jgi:UPF0271 protein
MKKRFYLIDTSAILSGKPLVFPDAKMVTTPAIADELSPGGRDYRNFQLIKEKGLLLMQATTKTESTITKIAIALGENTRLSSADITLLALAEELKQQPNHEILLITDDYSIQNLAKHLNIPYSSITQRGIIKKFKWSSRCRGCGKQFPQIIPICPICGKQTQFSPRKHKTIKKP